MYVNKNGTESFVNPKGFGYDGYIYNFNEKTKEYEKTDKRYDNDGYDFDELNEDGFDKLGLYNHKDRLNKYGFDYKHMYKGVYGQDKDKYGFDFYGNYTDKNGVKRKYDQHNFDRDGFLYVLNEETNEMEKTDKTLNDRLFDRDGFFYEFDEETNTFKKTKYKTDLDGKNIDGLKLIGQERRPDILAKREQERLEKEQKEREEREARIKKEEEEAQRRREEAHRKKLEFEEQKKKQKEEKELRKRESLQQREELLPEFHKKFDENGICISTGLKYDENYFCADERNIVTGTYSDYRGFNCIGQCVKNDHLFYDKWGFKQDGIHYLTNERFYKGYNCYGVDENGKYPSGNFPPELSNSRRYIKLLFEIKNQREYSDFLRNYAISKNLKTTNMTIKELKKDIFVAGEMYPPFKEEIQSHMLETKKEINRLNIHLVGLKRKKDSNQTLILNLEKEIKNLQAKINNISLDTGEK